MSPSAALNLFGPNFPVGDAAAMVLALGIAPGDRVLEVGGAGNPFPRADVVCDLTFASCAQRNGAPGVFRADVTYVEAPAERLPFLDGEFDFVYSTQVLEHVTDPEAAAREMSRVARRGFVEVPSRLGELLNGNPTHRWIVDREGNALVFYPRTFVEHPLRNFFYGVIFRDPDLRLLAETSCRNLFNHQVLFEGRLDCRIRAVEGPRFDYDDPSQAARAHGSFARNALAAGADPAYAYPDAVLAARLAPRAAGPALLLAVYEARLLRPEAAVAALEGIPGPAAGALRGLLREFASGRLLDPRSIPIPAEDTPCGSAAASPRPLVSVVVAGASRDDLLASAESALTQDYPEVEVLVSAPGPLAPTFSRLVMGERLRLLDQPAGATAGACLNRAALAARGGIIAFLSGGERFLGHHLDLLIAHLGASGQDAVHGDRLLVTGEGVAGPDIHPGEPSSLSASLSTLVARRDFLVGVGAFEEEEGDLAPLRWLLKAARSGRIDHVREVTVLGRGPLPSGASVLEDARAMAAMNPLAIARDLMAAHVREEGLRARVRMLEARLGAAPPPGADS